MKLYITMIAALFALPAQAVSVSNLDDESHVVVFQEARGSKLVRHIDPGETIRTTVATGFVSLKAKPDFKIPIYPRDRLAIWGDGNIQLQMRRHSQGGD